MEYKQQIKHFVLWTKMTFFFIIDFSSHYRDFLDFSILSQVINFRWLLLFGIWNIAGGFQVNNLL